MQDNMAIDLSDYSLEDVEDSEIDQEHSSGVDSDVDVDYEISEIFKADENNTNLVIPEIKMPKSSALTTIQEQIKVLESAVGFFQDSVETIQTNTDRQLYNW